MLKVEHYQRTFILPTPFALTALALMISHLNNPCLIVEGHYTWSLIFNELVKNSSSYLSILRHLVLMRILSFRYIISKPLWFTSLYKCLLKHYLCAKSQRLSSWYLRICGKICFFIRNWLELQFIQILPHFGCKASLKSNF